MAQKQIYIWCLYLYIVCNGKEEQINSMANSIAIASDHAGVDLKEHLKRELGALGFEAKDFGTKGTESVDYPDFAHVLAEWVEKNHGRGVLICGSGIGMSIAANRHKGVRAALCQTPEQAALARQHNDANVLCFGARVVNTETAMKILRTFLNTKFEGGRHQRRVEKMEC
jgi:ribose 5-phosphate isomerase B